MKVRLDHIISLILSMLLLTSAVPSLGFSPDNTTNDQVEISQDTLLEEQISGMTPEQKIGQLLMIGILESEMDSNLRKRFQRIKPGFLILFRKNIHTPMQTANLIYNLQSQSFKNSKLQMIVAVDQEGGDVVRIPTKPALPTALALGRSFDLENTFHIGKYVGEVLSVLGIHMNLAPVLDLSDPEKLSFIQTRSFGENPIDVAKISNEFARGVQSAGVLSTAKHFPGLGHLKEDSHKGVFQNHVSKEEFFSKYLKPYEELTREKSISAVMMTHLIYPELDPTLKPATFSAPIINILKNNLKFKGLIVTDDVEMAGAKFYKNPEERAVQAFLAGNDILMVAWNKSSQRRAYKGLLNAYKTGQISEERLNFSLKKIVKLKLSMGLNSAAKKPNSKTIFAKLRDNSLKQPVNSIFEKIMNQELSRLSNKILPSALKKIAVMSADYAFYKKFKISYRNRSQFIPITKNFPFKNYLSDFNNSSLLIINVSGPYSAVLANSLPLSLKKKAIVLNSRYLGSIKNEEQFLDVLQLSMKHADVGTYLGSYLDSHINTVSNFDRNLSSSKMLTGE